MNKKNSIKRSFIEWFHNNSTISYIVLGIILSMSVQNNLQAQTEKYTRPSLYFGVAAGANLNFYRGSTHQMNADFTPPVVFHDGFGVGLYAAPLIEFYKPESRWGLMFQVGYDSRKGTFNTATSPCNCPADLNTNLNYITVEPSLRFAPFKSNFYLFGGPRFAFNLNNAFIYQLNVNPDYPNQIEEQEVTGDFSDVNSTIISMQIAAGYDIPLSSQDHRTQFVLSPFVSFHPYFGQDPRSIETWNLTTVRIGAALKFGRGSLIDEDNKTAENNEKLRLAENMKKTQDSIDAVIAKNVLIANSYKEAGFRVNSPKNIPVERKVRETFPLRNYVFFDLGSTEIPNRYVLINKNQVKDFKEDQLETFTPLKLSERSKREMVVYYNILNILGDRMQKNPSSTIILVGSSEKGPEDGLAMASSIKKYLVEVWSITQDRIAVEGNYKPEIPSEQEGGTLELELLRQGDRRVSIESTSPALLMEFQTGRKGSLKPVQITTVQTAPIDSYVSFNAMKGNELYNSWSLEIKDKDGIVQNFGPYTQNKVSIPGKSILGTKSEGDYKVTMVGKTKTNTIVRKDTTVHLVLWKPAVDEEGMRYSILYEFNESTSIQMYEKYLTDIVAPKIPSNATVIIHGHSDIIGDEANNERLSTSRANNVYGILKSALDNLGRKDIIYEVDGLGENEILAPFENNFPEERFYNRTVIIDVIPKK